MVLVEKSFPRGGVPTKEVKDIKDKIIFGALQKKLKKPKTKKSKSATEGTEHLSLDVAAKQDNIDKSSAQLLSYDTIQDGMNIMGMIKAVDSLYLTVSLPGRITARVSALEISESYTKATNALLSSTDDDIANKEPYKTLHDMYKPNQIVYGRVKELVKKNKSYTNISLTLKPAEVHADVIRTNIKTGFIFNGAIEEIQEHGYIVESGIKGMRAFLPRDESNKSKEDEYFIGQLIYLKVNKITQDKMATTCICKIANINSIKIKKLIEPNIDYILPTTIVKFHVSKKLKNGLQGTIMNGAFIGYVNEHHLNEPLILPDDIDMNAELDARILYVMPLTKFVYLTLNLHKETKTITTIGANATQRQLLKCGDIIEDAKVYHLGTGGVILILNNKFKGIISYKSIKSVYKGNYDEDEVLKRYAMKTQHKVRILDYDLMDSMYICTDNKQVVNEKYFSLNDLQAGDFVTAVIVGPNEKVNGYNVQIGNLKGIIESIFLAPASKTLEGNSKIRCRVISINKIRKTVYLTTRLEYMSKSSKILVNIAEAKQNMFFTGTIVKCNKKFLLIKFFNDVRGILYLKNNDSQQNTETFYEGQTTDFKIVKNNNNEQLTVTFIENSFDMGEICPVKIASSLESGLEINIFIDELNDEQNSNGNVHTRAIKGLIPIRLLSDFLDLLPAKLHMYAENEDVEAVSFGNDNIFSLRDVEYFKSNITKNLRSVKKGEILRSYVKNIDGEIVELMIPLGGLAKKLVKLHWKMLLVNVIQNPNVVFTPEQVIYVKVLGKELSTNTISVSAKLTDVWDGNLVTTGHFIESYLTEVSQIKAAYEKINHPIAQYSIGDKIKAQFVEVDAETGNWHYILPKTKIVAVVKSSIIGKSTPSVAATTGAVTTSKSKQLQECIILWIDYSNKLLLVSNKKVDIERLTNSTQIPTNLTDKTGVNAKILLKLEQIFICSLKKGRNPLIFCPLRLHFNDFEQIAGNNIKEGEFCRLAFVHKTRPIAVLEMIWKTFRDIKRKRQIEESEKQSIEKATKKRKFELDTVNMQQVIINSSAKTTKLENNKDNNLKEKNKQQQIKNENVQYEDKKSTQKILKTIENGNKTIISNVTTTASTANNQSNNNNKELVDLKPDNLKLSSIANFWTTDFNQLAMENTKTEISSDEHDDDDDDDDDDEKNEGVPTKKKKRLNAGEKFKKEREEEKRLREIENKLADPKHVPETVDQFDRLVVSEPNISKNWINYMAFHLQSAELDKARAIAKRALRTISYRYADELLNIWIAQLNLELNYGGKESFNETLKEALTHNDPLKVYLRSLDVLTAAQKIEKLIEIIGTLTRKFKGETEVWKAVGNAYFRVGMTERGQQMLHKAMSSLPEKEHVNMIVTFAQLNHRHGQNEMAQTLLDEVVTSYPKRVDVWTQYIDLLIKDNLIDSARAILERAVIQNIPLKKMRTIFKKYLEFEERFGNEKDVENVKKLAADYVKKHTGL